MIATTWESKEKNWGDLAHQEVMSAFAGQMKTRAIALCVWFLAVEPDASPYAIETLARRDPDIETRSDGAKINAYSIRQARKILDGTNSRPRTDRRRSDRRKMARRKKNVVGAAVAKLDSKLAARLGASAEVIDDYIYISTELAMLQATFAKALRALLSIPHEEAIELADIEPNVAHVLAREGLLNPPNEEPAAVWPDAND